MKSHLKVKIFSQSAEMTYIRRQEDKWKNRARYARQRLIWLAQHPELSERQAEVTRNTQYAEDNFWTLRAHRVFMKPDARWSHLAYGCMKGVPYYKMEHLCYGAVKGYGSSEPNWERIEQLVAKFAGDEPNHQEIMQRFAAWLPEAKMWYEGNPMRIAEAMTAREALKIQQANDPVYQQAKLERHMTAMSLGKAQAAQP